MNTKQGEKMEGSVRVKVLRKFGAWETTDCDACGFEYQVTRTEKKEMERCICNECEIYAKAYIEGYDHGKSGMQPPPHVEFYL